MPTPDRPTVLVVQPDVSCPLERFGPWLTAQGLTSSVVRPFAGEPVPALVRQDALVVLGGDMSARDDDRYPWLADVRLLLRDAGTRGRPVLGICLGAQLLAQAFGGAVAVGDRGPEAGVVRVSWRAEAAADPLVGGLPSPFLSAGMHRDMVSVLPQHATPLGGSEQYAVQAFRVGVRAWGVQFHPELSPALYRAWMSALDPEDEGFGPAAAGLAGVEQLDTEVAAHTELLARRFAAVVHRYCAVDAGRRTTNGAPRR